MGIRHAFCLDIMGIRWFSGHSDGILSLCVFCRSVKVETDHGITFCPRLVHHPRQEHLWGRQADNCQSLRASVWRRQFLNADRWYRCMFNEFQWSIRHQTLFAFIGNNKIFVHTDPRGLPGLLGFDGMCSFGMGNFLLILKCPFDLWTNPMFSAVTSNAKSLILDHALMRRGRRAWLRACRCFLSRHSPRSVLRWWEKFNNIMMNPAEKSRGNLVSIPFHGWLQHVANTKQNLSIFEIIVQHMFTYFPLRCFKRLGASLVGQDWHVRLGLGCCLRWCHHEPWRLGWASCASGHPVLSSVHKWTIESMEVIWRRKPAAAKDAKVLYKHSTRFHIFNIFQYFQSILRFIFCVPLDPALVISYLIVSHLNMLKQIDGWEFKSAQGCEFFVCQGTSSILGDVLCLKPCSQTRNDSRIE